MTKQVLQQALRRAYQLGQDYWYQADSDSYRQNRKADETQRKFEALVEETCEALAQQGEQPLFWFRPRSDGMYEGPIHNAQIEQVRRESGAWVPLYAGAAPAAQPVDRVAVMQAIVDRDTGYKRAAAPAAQPDHIPDAGKMVPPTEPHCDNPGRCAHPFCSCGGSNVANA